MSEDPSQEKTEEPTAKRLKDSKDKGQVARSKDLNSLFILVFAGFTFVSLGPMFFRNMGQLITKLLSFNPDVIGDPAQLTTLAKEFVFDVLILFLPFVFLNILSTFLGPILIGGFTFSMKALAPKFERMSPLKGIKRMFSVKSIMELVKAFLKFSVVAAIAILVWTSQINDFLSIGALPLHIAIPKAFTMLAWSFLYISCSLLFIAIIDVPFQLFQHNKSLKMTKQEVKDEYKETEGKPEVKAQIRHMQKEVAQRRMMQDVPKADVILTNPSHFAVALSYNEDGYTAPTVLAKGQDHMALNIGKIAKAHDVPILRLPPLARSIYFSTEVGHEIPRGLFIAVAQVLAYVFQLKRKVKMDDMEVSPEELTDLPIPDELKRDADY